MKAHKGEHKEKIKASKKDTVSLKKEEYECLKKAAAHAEELKDKYLRAHAELDNAQKRFGREREGFVKFANESLLSEILYVVDNFDRALGHMNNTKGADSVLDGIKMIQKQFHQLLERNGVKRIEAIGKKFDPQLHEAVGHVEGDEKNDGIVVEEVQAGYTLNDRLLRPAAVKVGKSKK